MQMSCIKGRDFGCTTEYLQRTEAIFNPLKTSAKNTWAGVYSVYCSPIFQQYLFFVFVLFLQLVNQIVRNLTMVVPNHWIWIQTIIPYLQNFNPLRSIPCLAAYQTHGAGKYIHINVRILPGTHLYSWVESSAVDGLSCWRTKVRSRFMSGFEPATLWFRVKGSIQYTTTPLRSKCRPMI